MIDYEHSVPSLHYTTSTSFGCLLPIIHNPHVCFGALAYPSAVVHSIITCWFFFLFNTFGQNSVTTCVQEDGRRWEIRRKGWKKFCIQAYELRRLGTESRNFSNNASFFAAYLRTFSSWTHPRYRLRISAVRYSEETVRINMYMLESPASGSRRIIIVTKENRGSISVCFFGRDTIPPNPTVTSGKNQAPATHTRACILD